MIPSAYQRRNSHDFVNWTEVSHLQASDFRRDAHNVLRHTHNRGGRFTETTNWRIQPFSKEVYVGTGYIPISDIYILEWRDQTTFWPLRCLTLTLLSH